MKSNFFYVVSSCLALEIRPRYGRRQMWENCFQYGGNVKTKGVLCDNCESWYHYRCGGTTELNATEETLFIFYNCQAGANELFPDPNPSGLTQLMSNLDLKAAPSTRKLNSLLEITKIGKPTLKRVHKGSRNQLAQLLSSKM